MVSTTHALVGAVIGKNIDNLWIIIPLSLVSHFALDSIKHGEYVPTFKDKHGFRRAWWKCLLDITIGAAIIFSIIKLEKLDPVTIRNMIIGVSFSLFPDLLTLFYREFPCKLLEKIYEFHVWCHRIPRNSPERKWGLEHAKNDILISLAAIVILLLL